MSRSLSDGKMATLVSYAHVYDISPALIQFVYLKTELGMSNGDIKLII